MSDAWEEIQAFKSKRKSLRKKLEERKKGLQGILNQDNQSALSVKGLKSESSIASVASPATKVQVETEEPPEPILEIKPDPDVEKNLLKCLGEVTLTLPTDSRQLVTVVRKTLNRHVPHVSIVNLLQKFAFQELISIKEAIKEGKTVLEIVGAEHNRLLAMVNDLNGEEKGTNLQTSGKKRKGDECSEHEPLPKTLQVEKEEKKKETKEDDIMSLLSMPSTREKETKKVGEEILDLLSKPTAKERSIAERFRSQGGAQVKEFCPHGTKIECMKVSGTSEPCKKLHFKKIIQKHTDESLGDCSFLNTCFHMDTCKYVHYEVDGSTVPLVKDGLKVEGKEAAKIPQAPREATVLYPPQWIQCDLRYLDMTVLGKFAVIMADPPWDIHMELPYGTMSDDEMRQLNIPALQDEGLIFLWVTGRAMELGRECLLLWGYERVDEIIWVKTNQLQRIIRTGRTGHWLNHGKEHCLVGMKGNPTYLNRGLDCDVIVAEVRATSHKPDEIYGIIERLSPGSRKIELFGRMHNVQPNWITLGNQLDGVRLMDPELIKSFKKRFPDGNCMVPPKT